MPHKSSGSGRGGEGCVGGGVLVRAPWTGPRSRKPTGRLFSWLSLFQKRCPRCASARVTKPPTSCTLRARVGCFLFFFFFFFFFFACLFLPLSPFFFYGFSRLHPPTLPPPPNRSLAPSHRPRLSAEEAECVTASGKTRRRPHPASPSPPSSSPFILYSSASPLCICSSS